jgi:hypothetical protein
MYTWRELVALYRLTDPAPPTNLQPRYNVCIGYRLGSDNCHYRQQHQNLHVLSCAMSAFAVAIGG